MTITRSDAVHIGYALRMKPNDTLIFTRDGVDYHSVIDEIGRDYVSVHVIREEQVKSEPELRLTLYQALPKADKMDFIIQKSTELGVHRIVPFISERCVARPKTPAVKIGRWQRIAESAAKQSGRGIVPEVSEIRTFSEIIGEFGAYDSTFFCNENGGKRISVPPDTASAALIVGAEGGFTVNECTLAEENGAESVTLGARILRCETAPIVGMSVIMYAAGEI
jgi:16S rRNA (uracil1498-N3)-methyltransferase